MQTVTVHLHRRGCGLPQYYCDVQQSTCCFLKDDDIQRLGSVQQMSQSLSSNTRCVLNLHPAWSKWAELCGCSVKGESGSACFFGLFCSFLPRFYFCVSRRFIVLLHPFPSSCRARQLQTEAATTRVFCHRVFFQVGIEL